MHASRAQEHTTNNNTRRQDVFEILRSLLRHNVHSVTVKGQFSDPTAATSWCRNTEPKSAKFSSGTDTRWHLDCFDPPPGAFAMGLLSKTYARKGKGLRQANIQGFLKPPQVHGGVASDVSAGGGSTAGGEGGEKDAVMPPQAGKPGKVRNTGPDPFDFESSFDASIGPAINTTATTRDGALTPTSTSTGTGSPAGEGSPDTAMTSAGDFRRLAKSKRRRVTFAAVEEYALAEDGPTDDDDPGDKDVVAMEDNTAPNSGRLFAAATIDADADDDDDDTPAWARLRPSPFPFGGGGDSDYTAGTATLDVGAFDMASTAAGANGRAIGGTISTSTYGGSMSRTTSQHPKDTNGNQRSTLSLPESGEHLADLDEAQYALSGIGIGQPAMGRLQSATTLVALMADSQRRRVLTAQGLAPRLMRAALQLCALATVSGGSQSDGSSDGGRGRGGGGVSDPSSSAGSGARAGVGAKGRSGAGLSLVGGRQVSATQPMSAPSSTDKPISGALQLAASSLLYLASLDLCPQDAAVVFAARDTVPVLAALLAPALPGVRHGRASEPAANLGGESGVRAGAYDWTVDTSSTQHSQSAAERAEQSAEKNIRQSLRALRFLPNEEVEAPTLALLVTHRRG